jgi:hypothetical protein
VVFCRVYLNRQTAVAHQRVFEEIETIVRNDTGKSLRWRHLHAGSADETDGMILHWVADQHGGQAKGGLRGGVGTLMILFVSFSHSGDVQDSDYTYRS